MMVADVSALRAKAKISFLEQCRGIANSNDALDERVVRLSEIASDFAESLLICEWHSVPSPSAGGKVQMLEEISLKVIEDILPFRDLRLAVPDEELNEDDELVRLALKGEGSLEIVKARKRARESRLEAPYGHIELADPSFRFIRSWDEAKLRKSLEERLARCRASLLLEDSVSVSHQCGAIDTSVRGINFAHAQTPEEENLPGGDDTELDRRKKALKQWLSWHLKAHGYKPTYKKLANDIRPSWNTRDPISKYLGGTLTSPKDIRAIENRMKSKTPLRKSSD